jgi:CHAT domain-containing protein
MTRKTTLFVIGFLVFFLAIHARRFPPSDKAEGLYREANRLFNLDNPSEKSDFQALRLFDDVIRVYQKEALRPDTTLFFSHFKKGVIHEVYTAYSEAKNDYLAALSMKAIIKDLSDSICFPAYLYAGSAYYHLNQFDSAEYYFLTAEDILDIYPGVKEKNRLFNSLGALYYESGNYRQSHNYFVRGLELTEASDKEAIINFRINIGASAIKLGAYERALNIYEEVIRSGVLTDEIYQNMGKAYKALGKPEEALRYFKRVDPQKVPAVNNEIALALIRLKNYDHARLYLAHVDPQINTRINATDVGTRELYSAILEKELGHYDTAVIYLQQAIIHLSAANFSDTSIASNPTNFTGTFTSYKLFDALAEKGILLHEIYRKNRNVKQLLNSFAAFKSAIALVHYIGQSYDTDDARLFIKDNTQHAFQGAFRVCMELAKLFPEKSYPEEGFLILESNKASVLAGGVRENRLKKESGIEDALIKEEQQVKLEIAKLNLQAETITDDSTLSVITAARRNQEIRLSQLQKSFEKNSTYLKVKYREQHSGTSTIRNLIDRGQAVISYAISDSQLHAFVLDRDNFNHIALGEFSTISKAVEDLVTELKRVEPGYRFQKNNTTEILHHRVILPIEKYIKEKKELIIIPDGILYFLPFEILRGGENEQPLLFSKTISYHFSTRLLSTSPLLSNDNPEVLAFAPYVSPQSHEPGLSLPSSGEEIQHVRGSILINETARKRIFLDSANHFGIVHLATHAFASINNPSGSYISFYPESSKEDSRLYLDELYGLQLDSVKLVIMSACQTGDGKLVNGEGVMSLSRGFAYAGAQSVVTSFWKADDQSTAFIVKRFHEYIRKGKKRSVALQQAKVDYLGSDALHKTPNYWAHLVLIGDPSPLITESSSIWPWLAPIGFMVIGIWLARRKRPRTGKK